LYKKDYKALYLLQNRFLDWWVTFGLPFYHSLGLNKTRIEYAKILPWRGQK